MVNNTATNPMERRNLPRPSSGLGVRVRERFITSGSRVLATRLPSIANVIEQRFGRSEENLKNFYKTKVSEKTNTLVYSNITGVSNINDSIIQQNDILRQIIDELKNLSGSGDSGGMPDLGRGKKGRAQGRAAARKRDQARKRLQRRAQFRRIGARAGKAVRNATMVGRQAATRLSSVVNRGRQAAISLRERFIAPQQRQSARIEPTLQRTPASTEQPRTPMAPSERQVERRPRVEPRVSLPPPAPPPPVDVARPPAPPPPVDVARPPAPPAPPETSRTQVTSVIPETPGTPGIARRAGRAALSVLNVADRILAPTIFLDIERALRDLGDRAEYLPVQKLQRFYNTLKSAQENVETYNALIRSLDSEQNEANREELEKDIQELQARIVSQRNRLIQLVTTLDTEAQQQYQRRIRLAQDEGRTTVGERLVRLAPILSYVLGDERDTSLEAIRRPTDFKALVERALSGAPLEEPENNQSNNEEPQSPNEDIPTNTSDLVNPASFTPDSDATQVNDALPVDNESSLPYPENIIDLLSKTEFNELKLEAETIKFDGTLNVNGQTNATAATPVSSTPAMYSAGASFTPPSGSQSPQQSDATAVNAPPASQSSGGETKTEPTARDGGQQTTPAASPTSNETQQTTTPTPDATQQTTTPVTPNTTAETPIQQNTPTNTGNESGSENQATQNLTFNTHADQRINQGIASKVRQLQGDTGKNFIITSGYRDPIRNRNNRGASNSAHMRHNAVDIQFRGNEQDTLKVIQAASAAGIGGIGVYSPGWLHLDTEGRRAWGPTFHYESIPQWAKASLDAHLSGQRINLEPGSGSGVGQSLVAEGTNMAAGDQALVRGAGQQTTVPQQGIQIQSNQQQTAVANTTHNGEVPLNKRFENQVAA